MFDIGFFELLVIAVIGLVVLGPERLPGAIRTTAYWVSKIRRSFQSAKEELEKELDVDGIKRQIHNEQVLKDLEKTRNQVSESLESLSTPLDLVEPVKEQKEAVKEKPAE